MKAKTIIWLVVTVGIVAGVAWACWWFSGEPVISVDYLAKANEMRKPADYDVDEDGVDDYTAAYKLMDYEVKFPRMPGLEKPYDWSYAPGLLIWPGDMSDADRAAVKQWFVTNNEAFKLTEKALTKKYCWLRWYSTDGRLRSIYMRDETGMSNIWAGLIWRAKTKAYEGDVKGSYDDISMASRLAGFSSEKPAFIQWLWQMRYVQHSSQAALVITSKCNVSSDQLKGLAEQIEQVGRKHASADAAIDEMSLTFYDTVQGDFSDDGRGDGRLLASALCRDEQFRYYINPRGGRRDSIQEQARLWPAAVRMAWSADRRKATVAAWDVMVARLKEFVALEPWQAKEQGKSLSDLQSQADKNAFVGMYSSWMLKAAASASSKYTANVRGTLAVIAVLRYKADKGRLPEGWDELVEAGYLKEAPRDVYTGKPLIYRTTSDGFTVYSVGEDCTDDGGDNKKDIVTWPPEVVSPLNEAKE